MLLQIPTPDKLTAFDTLGPVAITIFFVTAITVGFLMRKVVWGTELQGEQEEREKEVASVIRERDEALRERDEEKAERKKGEAEIREIQDDYRRVIDDYKRLFDQLLFMVAGDALRKKNDE